MSDGVPILPHEGTSAARIVIIDVLQRAQASTALHARLLKRLQDIQLHDPEHGFPGVAGNPVLMSAPRMGGKMVRVVAGQQLFLWQISSIVTSTKPFLQA